jgi:hypothetical protein
MPRAASAVDTSGRWRLEFSRFGVPLVSRLNDYPSAPRRHTTTPCWLPKIAPGPVIFIFPLPVPETVPLRMPMNAPDTEWAFIWSQAPFPM